LEISIANTADYARYVIGVDQQPFHTDTGWIKADDEALSLVADLQDSLIDAYFSVIDDPFLTV
jgi:hypothetical protein